MPCGFVPTHLFSSPPIYFCAHPYIFMPTHLFSSPPINFQAHQFQRSRVDLCDTGYNTCPPTCFHFLCLPTCFHAHSPVFKPTCTFSCPPTHSF
ncbi:hypothetical protein PAXRUDRAFT_169619 [Paxillus rubicundulus Ve08.2h10]|uniref:Uncharacterized protein n=1 Tax=Paxillus rubicundulus Ve08.2h10 TaxID=930991 RepID=A0A0D0CZ65_9AGAM|nr:hypothetical protein PAXRUDRAFT_169619 [Paxillus rubicundulus Ve08.2h10]